MNIHFEKKGEGPPVVLLHGWGCQGGIFEALARELSQSFTVFSLDLPGFGKSEAPAKTWGVYEYTNAVVAFLKEHNITNPIVLGHSFGGKIAMVLATSLPVSKLIVTGSTGIKPTRNLFYYIKIGIIKAAKKLLSLPVLRDYKDEITAHYIKNYGSSDYKAATPKMKKILSKAVNEDVTVEMQRIAIPTLLIWGKKDTATPLQNGEKINQLIKDSTLVIFEKAGHYTFLDEPKRFYTLVHNFLSK